MSNPIKTIFIGTPDFSLPSLRSLINDSSFNVVGIITQPDKKQGRKQILTPPPVKTEALKHGIPVYQPEKISGFEFPDNNIDLIVVAAYAQIIPKRILDLPKYGCVNVHGSLLPYCRGAACVQQPIIDGQEKTGVTIMLMDEKLDTGPIIGQKEIMIKDEDTAGTMMDKLANLGGKILVPLLKDYISGKIKPIPQDANKATYVKTLKKENGKIDWNKPAAEVERFIRAMQPWPGAFSLIGNKTIKFLKTGSKPLDTKKYKVGELFIDNGKLFVECSDKALEIIELQIEGKNPMASGQFVCGYANLLRTILQ
jgi:methionyl-tRNA formyltransferase